MESTLPVTDTKYWYTMPKCWTPCYHCECHSKNNQFKFFISTASNDIQQHVNSANSGHVDIRNLTVTLIRTVVLQRSWYHMPGCSVQWKINKNTHGYTTVWYTKGIHVSFVNCFVVILPHHKNVLLLGFSVALFMTFS